MIIGNQIRKAFKLSTNYKTVLKFYEQSLKSSTLLNSEPLLNKVGVFNFCSKPKDRHHDSTQHFKVGENQKPQNQQKKSRMYEENLILKQMELEEFKIPNKYKNCSGCGVKFQTESQERLGFIQKVVLKEIVDHNKRIDDEIENGEIFIKRPNQFDESDFISKYMIKKGKLDQLKNVDNKHFIQIDDLDFLEEIDSQSTSGMSVFQRKQKDMNYRQPICFRCHQLKYQRNLIDQQSKISQRVQTEGRNEEMESDDDSAIDDIDQGSLIDTKDPEQFLKKAFKLVKRHSTIIFLVDATDLFATLNSSLIEYAFAQNHKIVLAVNKIDALPAQNIQQSLIKGIVRRSIQEKFPRALPLLEDIILVSAKNGEGMEKISKYIISAKMESKQYQHSRYSKHFYVMGYANTGKSSFINALNKATRRYLKNQKDEKSSSKGYSADEPNLNEQDKSMIKKLLGGTNVDGDEDDQELTTSSIPGTTVSFVKSQNKRLNVNIYDTPGIPNAHQLYHYFQNPNDAKIIVIDKKMSAQALTLSKDLTVLFGGLARIDQVQGIDINVAVFMSQNVSIHVTKSYKANEVFIKQYNNILVPVLHPDFAQVVFKRHVIDLTFDSKGKCEKDLEIFGLGWLSFTSLNVTNGDAQLFVYLPEGVQCYLRQSFYRFDRELMHKKIRTRASHSNLVERQKSYNIEKINKK